MTNYQLKVLMRWVDTRIDEKIEEAFRREGLSETMAEMDAREDLKKAFSVPKLAPEDPGPDYE